MKPGIQMERYGERGWEWSQPGYLMEGRESYRTNERGDGVWSWEQAENDLRDAQTGRPVMTWRQTVGTCDFHLPSSRSAAYGRILRRMMRRYQ